MSDNIQRSRGRGQTYKFDRGGQPAEMGPYIGEVMNNVDPTRSGRLQVYIKQFAGKNPQDKSLWRTVRYIPPFYGVTPPNNASGSAGVGTFKGNPQSYGMWFTPPDLGVQVICFFVAGDPNQGYYIGCIPDSGLSHMIPAVGATKNFKVQSPEQESLTVGAGATQLPVVEINDKNTAINTNTKFWDETKPVHSYLFGILTNQGLLGDPIRGPITSSSQRESPSAVFGMSTPGRVIYQGGQNDENLKDQLAAGSVKLADVNVEGRRGGHSFVMDDGDLQGYDNLIRIRTSKGHQITMSDDGDCFYFTHANGQTWIELGSEGTVDVYSSNSVNVRSQGTINLHADKDININAGENFNLRAKNIQIESLDTATMSSVADLTIYSKSTVGVLSDGSIALNSSGGGWLCNGALSLKAQPINLNSGGAPPSVTAPDEITSYTLDDTKFSATAGWQVEPGAIDTIVLRAPTHEPYPNHNKGVAVDVDYAGGGGDTPASASVTSALAATKNTPVTNAVTASSVLTAPAADAAIGNLDKAQVTGLLAQAKTATAQAADVVSVDKGIGQYGFKPDQLESSGFLKPGTVSQLNAVIPGTPTAADIAEAARTNLTPQAVAKNRAINAKLASPTLWTGQSGVSNLTGLLGNEKLQNTVQQQLMNTTLTGLKTAGVASGTEKPQDLSALLQSATKFGVAATAAWSKGLAPDSLKTAINATAKSAQFSTDFVDTQGTALGLAGKAAEVAENTVNRDSVDKAIGGILNDPKIPSPEFKPIVRRT